MGDFSFYGSTKNGNRPGGNYNDILVFNSIISHLGLIELPIKGRSFTWSNMQDSPLLEQIDWFFTSVSWTTKYPSILVLPMARIISDHLPCKVQISTTIPKANILGLKIFGSVTPPACRPSVIHGLYQQDSLTVLILLVLSSSCLGKFSRIGQRACQISPNSLPIATSPLLF